MDKEKRLQSRLCHLHLLCAQTDCCACSWLWKSDSPPKVAIPSRHATPKMKDAESNLNSPELLHHICSPTQMEMEANLNRLAQDNPRRMEGTGDCSPSWKQFSILPPESATPVYCADSMRYCQSA